MGQPRRILVTSINLPTSFQMVKALRDVGGYYIVGTDCSPVAAALYSENLAHATYVIPPASDERYIEVINEIIRKEALDLLIVTQEQELPVITKNIDSINTTTLLPDHKLVTTVKSKRKSLELVSDSVCVPRTLVANNPEDIQKAFQSFGAPIWIRGDKAQARDTAFKANDPDQAKLWITLKNGWGDYLLSEYLPGKNFCWVCLYKQGALVGSGIYERVGYFLAGASPSGVTGICSEILTWHRDDINAAGKTAVETLCHHLSVVPNGILAVDLKDDEHGMPYVTEINARPTNTYVFSKAGFNIADIFCRVALGESVVCQPFNCCRPGVYYLCSLGIEAVEVESTSLKSLFTVY